MAIGLSKAAVAKSVSELVKLSSRTFFECTDSYSTWRCIAVKFLNANVVMQKSLWGKVKVICNKPSSFSKKNLNLTATPCSKFVWGFVDFTISTLLFLYFQWRPPCESSCFTPGSWWDIFPWGTSRKRENNCSPHPDLILDWMAHRFPFQLPRPQRTSSSLICWLQLRERRLVSGDNNSAFTHQKYINRKVENSFNHIWQGSAFVGQLQRRKPIFRRLIKEVSKWTNRLQGAGHGQPRTLPRAQANGWEWRSSKASSTTCKVLSLKIILGPKKKTLYMS